METKPNGSTIAPLLGNGKWEERDTVSNWKGAGASPGEASSYERSLSWEVRLTWPWGNPVPWWLSHQVDCS